MTERKRHAAPIGSRLLQDAREIAAAIAALRRYGRPDILLTYGEGMGDTLLCTALLRELRRRGARNIWMASHYPELFQNNADADRIVKPSKWLNSLMKRAGVRYLNPLYAPMLADGEREAPPPGHIITEMCRKSGVTGTISRRPYLELEPRELEGGRFAENQIAMHSSGMAARWPIPLKEWYSARFQSVAAGLQERHTIIQLGSPSDPLIEGAIDLRGKTNLRESAAILSKSQAFIGQVGGLMHLARAVECRSVIVFGGREHPSQSGYGCNENIYSDIPCAPCWRRNTCPINRQCMQIISAGHVLAAVENCLNRQPSPLEIDTDVI